MVFAPNHLECAGRMSIPVGLILNLHILPRATTSQGKVEVEVRLRPSSPRCELQRIAAK